MTIFVDTNAVLDWLLDRTDTYDNEATTLFLAPKENRLTIYISSGCVYTIVCVLPKTGKRGQKLRDALTSSLTLVNIAGANRDTFIAACQLTAMTDLEDGLQYQTALETSTIQYFVTGSIKDFRSADKSNLPVVTPTEMIKLLSQ